MRSKIAKKIASETSDREKANSILKGPNAGIFAAIGIATIAGCMGFWIRVKRKLDCKNKIFNAISNNCSSAGVNKPQLVTDVYEIVEEQIKIYTDIEKRKADSKIKEALCKWSEYLLMCHEVNFTPVSYEKWLAENFNKEYNENV